MPLRWTAPRLKNRRHLRCVFRWGTRHNPGLCYKNNLWRAFPRSDEIYKHLACNIATYMQLADSYSLSSGRLCQPSAHMASTEYSAYCSSQCITVKGMCNRYWKREGNTSPHRPRHLNECGQLGAINRLRMTGTGESNLQPRILKWLNLLTP